MIKIYGVEKFNLKEDWQEAVKMMKKDLAAGDESIIAFVPTDNPSLTEMIKLAEGMFELPDMHGSVKMVPCERYNKELLDSLGLPY